MNKTRIVFAGGRKLGLKTLDWLCQQLWAEIVAFCPLPQDFDPENEETKNKIVDKYSLNILSIDELVDVEFDLGLSVNYHRIIKEDILNMPRMGFFNVHHSYNLRLRGRNIATQAILNSRKTGIYYHGTTLHKMVPELDAGPIVGSLSCDIEKKDTAYTLFCKVDKLAYSLLKEWLPRLALQKVYLYQPPKDGTSSFKNKDLPTKEIDYREFTDEDLWDFVRAFDFPGKEPAYILEGNRMIHLVTSKRDNYSKEVIIGSNTFYTD